jgi:2-oxoglutarate ferredoxin oxidoreductase subunit alpha/2-oxoisovalerate ferredoxin oxidoreductase alpha subunit
VCLLVVEAGDGQLEDELRLALSVAGLATPRLAHLRRHGGVLPTAAEIVDAALEVARAEGAAA